MTSQPCEVSLPLFVRLIKICDKEIKRKSNKFLHKIFKFNLVINMVHKHNFLKILSCQTKKFHSFIVNKSIKSNFFIIIKRINEDYSTQNWWLSIGIQKIWMTKYFNKISSLFNLKVVWHVGRGSNIEWIENWSSH